MRICRSLLKSMGNTICFSVIKGVKMDLFKEKMETWQGKLVRLKRDCTTGNHIYPKGLLMRINCVSTQQVRLKTMPCETCGIVGFMTIKGCKSAYANYFEFVEESELNNRECNNEKARF